MNYTVSLLSNKPDCQALINIAGKEKSDLLFTRTGLLRHKDAASATSIAIDTQLATVDAEISVLNSVLSTIAEGDLKKEHEKKLKKAEYKKFLLVDRRANYGSIAIVEKEYEIASIDQSVSETDAFIDALTARMDEVPE